jgi:hypothetical protein
MYHSLSGSTGFYGVLRGSSGFEPDRGRTFAWLYPVRSFLLLLLCSPLMTGCWSIQDLVNEQQKALISLSSTVTAVGNAWLEGNVSADALVDPAVGLRQVHLP